MSHKRGDTLSFRLVVFKQSIDFHVLFMQIKLIHINHCFSFYKYHCQILCPFELIENSCKLIKNTCILFFKTIPCFFIQNHMHLNAFSKTHILFHIYTKYHVQFHCMPKYVMQCLLCQMHIACNIHQSHTQIIYMSIA